MDDMDEMDDHQPKKEISVILAVRNEEGYIDKCLDSLLSQDLPTEKYEIIVIDGMSDDRTREVLSSYQKKFPRIIRVLDNLRKTQAIGRNIGIQIAQGQVILIFSGHAYASPLFIKTLMNQLDQSPPDVASVGGIHVSPMDETFLGKVIGDVQNSLLGGAGTSYRNQTSHRFVDTVGFCVYKKNILKAIGLYDEQFDIGEDIELNWRIKKSGHRLMVTPDALSYYYRKHSSFKLLSKRMFIYGIWRALVTKKHPQSFKVVFCAPVIILISLVSLPVLVVLDLPLADVVIVGLMSYFLAILISCLNLSIKRKSTKYFFLAIPIYLIEHLSIAIGFIVGLLRKLPER